MFSIYNFIISIIQIDYMCSKNTMPHMGEKRNAFEVLVGKPEGKRPLRG
jgi:hypothetical protein